MNVERLNILADYLDKAEPDKPLPNGMMFDMREWGFDKDNKCQAAGCIDGHARMLFGPEEDGAKLLGLTEDQRSELFLAWDYPIQLKHITPQMAAAAIRRLVDGKFPWEQN